MTADVDESSWNFNHKENDGNASPLVFQRGYHAALAVCKAGMLRQEASEYQLQTQPTDRRTTEVSQLINTHFVDQPPSTENPGFFIRKIR